MLSGVRKPWYDRSPLTMIDDPTSMISAMAMLMDMARSKLMGMPFFSASTRICSKFLPLKYSKISWLPLSPTWIFSGEYRNGMFDFLMPSSRSLTRFHMSALSEIEGLTSQRTLWPVGLRFWTGATR